MGSTEAICKIDEILHEIQMARKRLDDLEIRFDIALEELLKRLEQEK